MVETLMRIPITTPVGMFVAHYSARGLARLEFPNDTAANEPSALQESLPSQIQRWHKLTCEALNATLAGGTPRELPPMDTSSGTPFQQRVWEALLEIQSGKTWSYSQVAAAIGQPKAARAVGAACGANPIPVLIPCHRVLAAHNRLGGFGGGLDWKRNLLAREGVVLEA
jgi:O-6-methylguanine DNA methyltransferase